MKSIAPINIENIKIGLSAEKVPSLTTGVITIVGVGLISGSFALAMKEKGFAKKIIGVSRTEASLQKAMELLVSIHSLYRK